MHNTPFLPIMITLPVVMVSAPMLSAQTYLSVQEAQKVLFPEATTFGVQEVSLSADIVQKIEKHSGVRVRETRIRVWHAYQKNTKIGTFFIDRVIGKHEFITYACAINVAGQVRGIEVLDYRETYGGEVAHPKWREQFEGKSLHDPLKLGHDIRNISGGTLSCKNITNGVKRLLVTHTLLNP